VERWVSKDAPEATFSRHAIAHRRVLKRLPPCSPLPLALPRQAKLGPSSPSGPLLRQRWV
jgi:hypothetical protein